MHAQIKDPLTKPKKTASINESESTYQRIVSILSRQKQPEYETAVLKVYPFSQQVKNLPENTYTYKKNRKISAKPKMLIYCTTVAHGVHFPPSVMIIINGKKRNYNSLKLTVNSLLAWKQFCFTLWKMNFSRTGEKPQTPRESIFCERFNFETNRKV